MEWRPTLSRGEEKERATTAGRAPATESGSAASPPFAEDATCAAQRRPTQQTTPLDVSSLVTTGEAIDVVAAQCERRGLTSASTWLGEMSLHALPCVLTATVPPASAIVTVVRDLDADAVRSAAVPSSSTPLQLHFQRLHRVALGYFTKGEYQRCHQTILREIMRGGEAGSRGTGVVTEKASPPSMPSPDMVRGFRTTAVPSLLQFLSLYALFMDGMRMKQLGNNANAAASGIGGGGGGVGSQRAVHPHARVLRAYLLEAMRNPTNVLRPRSHAAAEATPPSSRPQPGSDTQTLQALERHPDPVVRTPAMADGWDPHTPSAKKQPWTITSASRVPAVGSAGRTFIAAAEGSSSAGSLAFSNVSPGTQAKPSAGSPAAATPAPGAAAASPSSAVPEVGAADLLHIDPYLTWLMGVVLRELRMRQECATFLLAAVTVNPLLRCAWEDLSSLVSRETQLVEIDAALDGVEPHFMMDIFAAEVRSLLGVTPVSTARLRSVAGAVAATGGGGGGETSSPIAATSAPLAAASPDALNGADVGDASAPRLHLGTADPAQAAAAKPSPPPPPPPPAASAASAAAAAPTNAWECLGLLFPDTPHLLSQLAHYYYHQRNKLDKAEAIYQRIRVLDPHYYAILYDYSNVLYTRRDRLGLSSLVQSVYHADAFRAETNFAVGNYYVLLGQHDRAALHFHRTTAIDPQCAEAWLLLGHAYVEVKNTTAAVEAYRTAVELNERDYRGWYNLGQIYELLEAYHHALYYYWHTTSLRPADPGMWVAVANCLEHDGRVAESIACLERAESYDQSSSPNYPAYVRRIATHHIANSSFTRACVYLEKLVHSTAATNEDLLLGLPFLIQHYVQRARKSMEVSARSASYDPALFSPGVNLSPASSPASGMAGRTALHHARAAAALQHLHKAEEHLGAMAELVMPGGVKDMIAMDGETEPVPTMAGLENYTDDVSASGRRRAKQAGAGVAAARGWDSQASAVAELPPIAFARSRYREIGLLKAQATQLLHPPTQSPSVLAAASAASAAASVGGQQSHQRGFFAPQLGRRS